MKKKKFWIVVILVVIIVVIVGFVIFKGLNKKVSENKEDNPVINENNQSLENFEGTVIEEFENVDEKDIYGFAMVLNDDGDDEFRYKIIALNANGSDIDIVKVEDFSGFYIRNNKLYIVNNSSNNETVAYENYDYDDEDTLYIEKSYVLDLNSYPYKIYKLTEGVEFTFSFDFTNKYFIAPLRQSHGILKYNFETEEKETIVFDENAFIDDSFIYCEKIYYTSYDKIDDYNLDITYYSVDFDGNNREKLSFEDFDKISKIVNGEDNDDDADAVIKKGKKIEINNESTTLYYGNEVIYSTKDSEHTLKFGYVSDSNVIGFSEYHSDDNGSSINDNYFYYYIDSGKLINVNEEDIDHYYGLIYK